MARAFRPNPKDYGRGPKSVSDGPDRDPEWNIRSKQYEGPPFDEGSYVRYPKQFLDAMVREYDKYKRMEDAVSISKKAFQEAGGSGKHSKRMKTGWSLHPVAEEWRDNTRAASFLRTPFDQKYPTAWKDAKIKRTHRVASEEHKRHLERASRAVADIEYRNPYGGRGGDTYDSGYDSPSYAGGSHSGRRRDSRHQNGY